MLTPPPLSILTLWKILIARLTCQEMCWQAQGGGDGEGGGEGEKEVKEDFFRAIPMPSAMGRFVPKGPTTPVSDGVFLCNGVRDEHGVIA